MPWLDDLRAWNLERRLVWSHWHCQCGERLAYDPKRKDMRWRCAVVLRGEGAADGHDSMAFLMRYPPTRLR